MIILYCLFVLMERIYQHRRNKAEESCDSNCHFVPLHFPRMSAGMQYSGPLTMRLSDMSTYQNYSPRKYQNKTSKIRTIKNNLKELQQKLSKAKNQLQTSAYNKHQKQTNRKETLLPQLKLFTCHQEDESTMNVDSQAFFKMVSANARRSKDYYVGTLIVSLNSKHPNTTKHIRQMMSTMKAALSLSFPSVFQMEHRKVQIQRSLSNCTRKTIALELDETILCLRSEQISQNQLQICLGGEKGFIILRPYALSFLRKISQHFQIVVYTRLEYETAKAIVDQIDHQGTYITHLLTKKNCLQINSEILTKDIRVLDRNLKDTIIIDSSPSSFIIQCDNAVPVLPYRGGQDRELVQLQRFLCRELLISRDVRQLCRKWFLLSHFWQFQSESELIQELYL